MKQLLRIITVFIFAITTTTSVSAKAITFPPFSIHGLKISFIAKTTSKKIASTWKQRFTKVIKSHLKKNDLRKPETLRIIVNFTKLIARSTTFITSKETQKYAISESSQALVRILQRLRKVDYIAFKCTIKDKQWCKQWRVWLQREIKHQRIVKSCPKKQRRYCSVFEIRNEKKFFRVKIGNVSSQKSTIYKNSLYKKLKPFTILPDLRWTAKLPLYADIITVPVGKRKNPFLRKNILKAIFQEYGIRHKESMSTETLFYLVPSRKSNSHWLLIAQNGSGCPIPLTNTSVRTLRNALTYDRSLQKKNTKCFFGISKANYISTRNGIAFIRQKTRTRIITMTPQPPPKRFGKVPKILKVTGLALAATGIAISLASLNMKQGTYKEYAKRNSMANIGWITSITGVVTATTGIIMEYRSNKSKSKKPRTSKRKGRKK